METLEAIWNIAQLAGAGGAVVLLPVSWQLWKQHKEDTAYIREADKNTLTVLGTLTDHLKNSTKQHSEVLREIQTAVRTITEHVQRRDA